MAKVIVRHHAVHPPTGVKPNTAVNPKPEAYVPRANTAAANPNPNPSLGQVGVDAINSRVPIEKVLTRSDASDVSDPNSPNYDPTDPNYDESLDDSE